MEYLPLLVSLALAFVGIRALLQVGTGIVDWRSAVPLSMAMLPGALLGPWVLSLLSLSAFLALLGLGILVAFWRLPSSRVLHLNPMDYGPPGVRVPRVLAGHRLEPRLGLPLVCAVPLGFVLSVLGVDPGGFLASVLARSGIPSPLDRPTARAAMLVPAVVALGAHAVGLASGGRPL